MSQEIDNDAISRKSVLLKLKSNRDFLKSLHKNYKLPEGIKIRVEEIDECISLIKREAPLSEKVAEKAAHWVHEACDIYVCSECGRPVYAPKSICSCGAKMEEKGNE